nr:hypothetical protein [Tanacetum cinerariifolium]
PLLPSFSEFFDGSKIYTSAPYLHQKLLYVDKSDPHDVQFQIKTSYDIASSVGKFDISFDLYFIQKVYEFKKFLDRLNDDDAIVVPHEDAQAIFGDTNDPFTSISMSKDFVDKNIATNDAY